MAQPFYLCAVVCRLQSGWIAFNCFTGGRITIVVGGSSVLVSREAAIDAFVQAVETYSDDPNHETKRCSIRWFDPSKDFSHCATGHLYDENGNTGKFVTFLSYKNGKAEVMATTGEQMLVNPEDISPCQLYRQW